jgi:F0F1-type ATP synthase membrane subunit b/b'
MAALQDKLGAARRHRQQLEHANAKLLRNLAEARVKVA